MNLRLQRIGGSGGPHFVVSFEVTRQFGVTATRVVLFVQSRATHLRRVTRTRVSELNGGTEIEGAYGERVREKEKEREKNSRIEWDVRRKMKGDDGAVRSSFGDFARPESSESSRVLSSLLLLLRHPQHPSWRTVWQTVLFFLSLSLFPPRFVLHALASSGATDESHGVRSRHSGNY